MKGMIGNRRVGGDTPEQGERAIEFIERWRRERRERRGNYWLKRLMAAPNANEKEANVANGDDLPIVGTDPQ